MPSPFTHVVKRSSRSTEGPGSKRAKGTLNQADLLDPSVFHWVLLLQQPCLTPPLWIQVVFDMPLGQLLLLEMT
jgi:hypothetical protein